MSKGSLRALGATVVCFLGCSDATEPPASSASNACVWDFEATVRSGPDMGLSLRGPLFLRLTSAGVAEGGLLWQREGMATVEIPVRATIDGSNNITMTFTLADGRRVTGTGPMGAAFSTCPRRFEGSANGPAMDDRGDWVVTSFFGGSDAGPTCTTPAVRNVTFSGGFVYVDAGGSCIQSGASMRVQIPFSTTQYGPYSTSFDESGTRIRAAVPSTAWPAGTCRVVYVRNPNGTEGSGSGCR